VLTLLLLAAATLDPDRPLPFDMCGFKYLTGLPCPTCGLTRALCHAIRGDWARSLGYHPAGPLLAMALVGWTLWSAAEAYSGQPIGERLRRGLGASLLCGGITLSVASWIVQLAGGRPVI
jgi:hypothetical protein